jgi:hypothetical protein
MTFPPSRHRRTGETPQDHAVERRCRDKLAKCGLKLSRDRAAYRTPSRRGGYWIFDPKGTFEIGRYYTLSLARVEMYADNFTDRRKLPEGVLIDEFARQEQAVLVGEIKQSIRMADAAVEAAQRRRA